MGEKETKPTTVFEEPCKCPHCKKKIIIRKTKKVITPAEPAEYDIKVVVEKDAQTTLAE